MSKDESLGQLRWLMEVGADEPIGELPVDRFAQTSQRTKQQSPSPLESAYATASADLCANPPKLQRRRVEGEGVRPSVSEGGRKGGAGDLTPPRSSFAASTLPQGEGGTSSARAIAAACQTLAELKAALESFQGCDLRRHAKCTVFADGNPSAELMFIGEAPGREEDEQGLPFVGRAGKLLDRMLAAADLDRSKVYITNVLNWRPPQNREPSPEEAAICLPFLHRHIQLAKPEILVLLGAVAVRHVLGLTEGIMRLRGNWQVYQTDTNAVPVMPTLHPAYLLRQPSAKRLAWRDLLAVTEKVKISEVA